MLGAGTQREAETPICCGVRAARKMRTSSIEPMNGSPKGAFEPTFVPASKAAPSGPPASVVPAAAASENATGEPFRYRVSIDPCRTHATCDHTLSGRMGPEILTVALHVVRPKS